LRGNNAGRPAVKAALNRHDRAHTIHARRSRNINQTALNIHLQKARRILLYNPAL
jgi:hypothetical protein